MVVVVIVWPQISHSWATIYFSTAQSIRGQYCIFKFRERLRERNIESERKIGIRDREREARAKKTKEISIMYNVGAHSVVNVAHYSDKRMIMKCRSFRPIRIGCRARFRAPFIHDRLMATISSSNFDYFYFYFYWILPIDEWHGN